MLSSDSLIVYKLDSIYETTIVKRPSAFCKTPYVADIEINGIPAMAHTPALGCCGLSDKDSQVMVSKISHKSNKSNKSSKQTCAYRVELACVYERGRHLRIGINPKLAEVLIWNTLQNHMLRFVGHCSKVEREVTYLNSRFDFSGVDEDGRSFVLEVKNVPLADYVDVAKSERSKYNGIERRKCYHEKIAYFPDGYRKNSTEVVSPRALKHIEELTTLRTTTNHRTILCFVIQRTDIVQFQPSNIDLTYKRAVQEAWNKGVEIYAIQYEWTESGECLFLRDDVPVMLYDQYGPQNQFR